MGRKALHTPEEVFAAADRLAASGQDVTASALLATLGGGSLTTIYRHLEAWEANRKDAPRPVTIEMPEAVSAAFARAWQAAAQEAGKEIAVIREKADAEVREARRRYEEALASIERLETEAEADAEQIESVTIQLADRDTALHEATTREAALKATVGQMERQIEAQQAELGQERQAANAAREEAARWRGQVEVLREKIKEEAKCPEGSRLKRDPSSGNVAEPGPPPHERGAAGGGGRSPKLANVKSGTGFDDDPQRTGHHHHLGDCGGDGGWASWFDGDG